MKRFPVYILIMYIGISLSLGSNFASAQEFRAIGDGRFAAMSGAIDRDGYRKFAQFLNEHPGIIGIQLNSPGGTVVSALSIADEIHRRQLSTYIAGDHTCASACSMIFFAGHDRLAEGRLGVHQMDDGGRSDASTLQFVLADQLDAFQRYNAPWTVVNYMLTTPPSDMHWLSSYDLDALAINRDLPGDATEVSKPETNLADTNHGLKFSDFPALARLHGSPSSPDFSGRDRNYRSYRTRIREGVSHGVSFAGHYTMIEIGCGTSCRFAFVVDLLTGEVGSFPYGGEEHYQMKLLFSPDSRLLKVRWMPNWDADVCTEQDLLLEGLDWRVLEERASPAIQGYCN
tara:strand:- start:5257 stop:6285 length:1029 start_codon:yes stop_codon:yes gene_type:complete